MVKSESISYLKSESTPLMFQKNITEVDWLIKEVSKINLSCVIFKINLIINPKQWWIDTGAIRHTCTKKIVFFTYKENREKVIHEKLIDLQGTRFWKGHNEDDL